MLDTTHPLQCLLEGLKGGNLSSFDIHSLALDALQLVGNAVCQTSRIRRKRVLKICNPDIANMAKREEFFTESAPFQFGDGFETKMKERAEVVKVLHKSQSYTRQPY